jgi:hypothetical protein
MSDKRTGSGHVPASPAEANSAAREAEKTKAQAMKRPAFREALKKDDEREAQSDFNPNRGIFGQTNEGTTVGKTDPQLSQKKEEANARREEGYVDGES